MAASSPPPLHDMDRFIVRSKLSPGESRISSPMRPSECPPSGPPLKRPRFGHIKQGKAIDLSEVASQKIDSDALLPPRSTPSDDESETCEAPDLKREITIESSPPPTKTGIYAVDEYEVLKPSRASDEDGPSDAPAARLRSREWVRSKSSIYVDAFSLALDTVLEHEAHLFDEKERAVFDQWRLLDYEAQYLYVRLFLRKSSAWHRVERLRGYSDIPDVGSAIQTLLQTRPVPKSSPVSPHATDESAGSSTGNSTGDSHDRMSGDSFAFAEHSDGSITTMGEAISLLNLDELKSLAKEAKVQGKNKAGMIRALCRMSSQQTGLEAFGLQRHDTTDSAVRSAVCSPGSPEEKCSGSGMPTRQDSNRNSHFLVKILAATGPLVRLTEPILELFERVHLVFYRSTEWTEKSLTAIILAHISRRNFPDYIVSRSCNIFPSRSRLLEFEHSIRLGAEVDKVLELNGPPGEECFRRVIGVFGSISSRWEGLLDDEQRKEGDIYECGEGAYLRRFNQGHPLTRIAHKAAYAYGRLREYDKEHALLAQLLSQRLFQQSRRGSWYQRKALLEEHYMWEASPRPASADADLSKKHWLRAAAATCEAALEDRDCHLIYHYDLQKRLVKLERRLRLPKRLQHDFGHVRLRQPEEHTVAGVQVKHDGSAAGGSGSSTKTVWLDELGDGVSEVSVESMCLSWYRDQGWKGYHSEGGILRTLFAYLFFDVLFLCVPNVFQTAYQTCPLDLHTDAFFPARASEINRRLVEIANGEGERILREVDGRERPRRTCVVGLNWDFDPDDLAELVRCFDGCALAAVCKVMVQEYGARGGGVPDLLLWRALGSDGAKGEVLFAEVKSANDRLSDTQRLWIHVLTGAGVRVALCNAVAKEVRKA